MKILILTMKAIFTIANQKIYHQNFLRQKLYHLFVHIIGPIIMKLAIN